MNTVKQKLVWFFSLWLVISSVVEARHHSEQLPILPNAKINNSQKAIDIAYKSYYAKVELLNLGISALLMGEFSCLISLDSGIPGFCSRYDKIWEIRFIIGSNVINAIAWVHSETGEVYYPYAYWQFLEGVKKENQQERIKSDIGRNNDSECGKKKD